MNIIKDEFTNLNISRQYRYQLRKMKNNECRRCGRLLTAEDTKSYCRLHAKDNNTRLLIRNGIKFRKYTSKYGNKGDIIIKGGENR